MSTVRSSLLRLSLAAAFFFSALFFSTSVPAFSETAEAPSADRFQPMDVFQMEYVSDPQVAPDGRHVVFVRNSMDVMKDQTRSHLWMSDGETSWPLTSGATSARSPRLSPDGEHLLYVTSGDDGSQLALRWLKGGHTAQLTQLTQSPRSLTWSPDGQWIAFTMFVPSPDPPFAKLPSPPPGAQWAPPAKVIDSMLYRGDGRGYLEEGYNQLFVLSKDGGTPRQVTTGPFNHGGTVAWTPDSQRLIFSANRRPDWQREPADSELFEISVDGGEPRQLTDRRGPDHTPVLSPDGRHLAFLGFDDRYQGYQITRLYVLDLEGGGAPRELAASLDRSLEQPAWDADGKGLFFAYSDRGNGKVGYVPLSGGPARNRRQRPGRHHPGTSLFQRRLFRRRSPRHRRLDGDEPRPPWRPGHRPTGR